MKAVALVALAAGVGMAYAEDSEWMSDERGVLELRLAHRDKDRVDGGTLRVDREHRTVSWEGAPNEIGCRRPWQASFDDVAGVTADAPGFVIALRRGADRQVRLAPLPHFTALLHHGRDQSVRPDIKESLKGSDGDHLPLSGSGGSTTPTLKPRILPPEVQGDSRAAVEAILRALGRGPR